MSQAGPVDSDVPEQRPVRPRRRGPRLLHDRADILAVIAVGGALGSLAGWALAEALPRAEGGIPWATWLANVTGALALGALMVFVLDVWPPRRYLRPFLGVGVLGGYTTFSTYMLDTRTLLAEGHPLAALVYLFGTLLTGLLAVWAGVLLARGIVVITERRRRHRGRARGVVSTPPPHRHRDPDRATRSRG